MSYFMLKHLLLCKIKVIFIVHLHTKFHLLTKFYEVLLLKVYQKRLSAKLVELAVGM